MCPTIFITLILSRSKCTLKYIFSLTRIPKYFTRSTYLIDHSLSAMRNWKKAKKYHKSKCVQLHVQNVIYILRSFYNQISSLYANSKKIKLLQRFSFRICVCLLLFTLFTMWLSLNPYIVLFAVLAASLLFCRCAAGMAL